MTDTAVRKLLTSLLFFFVLTACVYDALVLENNPEPGRRRYRPCVINCLPLAFALLMVSLVCSRGWREGALQMLSLWLPQVFLIAVYDVALLLILPLLRRTISARACALLWMLPNFLYIMLTNNLAAAPLLVVRIPGWAAMTLLAVWVTGIVTVLLWKLVSHLCFRAQILKDAVPVTEREILEIYQQALDWACVKRPRGQLVRSASAAVPMSIGLFRHSIRIILPARAYTPEELRLIFRHELVHIEREDAQTKFFLTFCTAMCWFLPPMWMAMQKSADDLELSCDEAVLADESSETRRQYATLLLTEAGDARGFTTCLSARAESMRYRLKNIVAPKKKHTGALAVGLVFFALLLSCGSVALAYDAGTGRECIYQGQEAAAFRLKNVKLDDGAYDADCYCRDEAALGRYLEGLKLARLTGQYSFDTSTRTARLQYQSPDGHTLWVYLYDRALCVRPMFGARIDEAWYYLSGKMDWAYLDTLLVAEPVL